MCVTQKRRSLNSLITGWADGPMGRLIPNFLRVVQILLEIVVVVSLRDYWRFPKEVDYSLICVATMHHPEHCQFCIIARFCFGTELHCSCWSAFWMIQWSWFSVGRTFSYISLRVSNLVICGYGLYELMWFLYSYPPRRASAPVHNQTYCEP